MPMSRLFPRLAAADRKRLSRKLTLGLALGGILGFMAAPGFAAAAGPFDVRFAEKPEHVILYIIDGLSYKTWDRLDLPVLKKMISGGVLVEKNYLPPSEHPTQGSYAELHSCSIPNPVMMSGTLFLTKETEYFPQNLFPRSLSAFVANGLTYRSLDRFYHFSYQKSGPDPEGVEAALEIMKRSRPVFMRVHLKEVGEASFQILSITENVPWRRNIWAEGSPYVKRLKRADELLGRFLSELEKNGLLPKTALLVMGDHGEADTGYHPPECLDASITSIILWGAGIKRGLTIPYAEHMDVVPTLCALLNIEPPKTCQGRVIGEALASYKKALPPRQMTLKKLLEQFDEFRAKEAEAAFRLAKLTSTEISRLYREFGNLRSSFYGIKRFVEWPRFKTAEELAENNTKALGQLKLFLEELRKL